MSLSNIVIGWILSNFWGWMILMVAVKDDVIFMARWLSDQRKYFCMRWICALGYFCIHSYVPPYIIAHQYLWTHQIKVSTYLYELQGRNCLTKKDFVIPMSFLCSLSFYKCTLHIHIFAEVFVRRFQLQYVVDSHVYPINYCQACHNKKLNTMAPLVSSIMGNCVFFMVCQTFCQ